MGNIFKKARFVPEPEIPFPQADAFTRVVDLLGLLCENDHSKASITMNYDFDERQTNYYTSAGMYLGLIDKYKNENKEVMYALTRKGRDIMLLRTRDKFLKLAESILAHKPFYLALSQYFTTGVVPEKQKVVELMKQCSLYHVNSESTYYRRASTVLGWINWILQLPETY